MPVHRIEAAHRIAHDEIPGGEALQFLVMTAQIRRQLVRDDVAQRLQLQQQLIDVGRGQAAREFQKAALVGRGVIARPAAQRHDPAIALDGKHVAAALVVRRIRRGDQQPRADEIKVFRAAAIHARRIAHVDLDLTFGRTRIAQRFQPPGGRRSASAGIHNQIGVEDFRAAVLAAALHLDADHARSIRRSDGLFRVTLGDHCHVGQAQYPLADQPFEQRAAHQHAVQTALELQTIAAVGVPAHDLPHIADDGAFVQQRLGEIGEVVRHDFEALAQQAVQMARLWLALTRFGHIVHFVAFDERHLHEVIAQDARGQQAGHAAADDNRARVFGHAVSPWFGLETQYMDRGTQFTAQTVPNSCSKSAQGNRLQRKGEPRQRLPYQQPVIND